MLATECRSALAFVAKVLPILGLIVRSATVRNAFEIYGPIKHIAEILLSEIPNPAGATGVKLVLSSGWDYMPFTFRPIEALTEFVFIVLPATESSNPLLVPIAGHELGHSVWARAAIWDQLQEEASSTLADYVRRNKTKFNEAQQPAALLQKIVESRVEYPRLARQLEEFFCDFLGLYLFGESFLHAFTYFLSPNSPFDPSPNYPKVEIRIKKLLEACDQFRKRWGTEIYTKPTKLTQEFVETEAFDSEGTLNQWQIAIDAVAGQLVPAVLKQIYVLARKSSWASLRDFSRNKANEIRDNSFRWAVPASNTGSLANLMNAAWDVARDTRFWDRLPSLQNIGQSESQQAKDMVLHELLLKNIEVLEYEQKIQIANAQTKRVTRSPKPEAKRVRR